jgi:AcrR family transcriptional regulator
MSNGEYRAHRESQRELILETAEELFIANGVEPVTVGDIAKASRLTRATIYKYFSNKEEMAGEILKTVTKGWVERDEREVWSLPGTGYEQIERFVRSHFDYLFGNPKEARFLAEFNYMYSKKMSVEAAMRLFAENLEGERRRLFSSIQKGQADGSVRADIGAEILLASILNFNSGMMSRLGELGDKVEGEYGLNVQSIFRQICRLFLDGIKADPARR